MLDKNLQNSKVKIALIVFILIFMFISIVNIFYINTQNTFITRLDELRRMPMKRIDTPELDARIEEQRNALLLNAIIIQTLLSIIGGFISYFVAGYFLDPINKSIESQKRFLKFASHELRTPISTITLIAESKEDNKDMESILEETEKLKTLTDKYLNLLTNEKSFSEINEFDLNKMVIDIIDSFQKEIENKNLSISLDRSKSINVKINNLTIYTVCRNLIENCIKYASKNSEVKIDISDHKIEFSNMIDQSITSHGYGIGGEIISYITSHSNLKIISQDLNGYFKSIITY